MHRKVCCALTVLLACTLLAAGPASTQARPAPAEQPAAKSPLEGFDSFVAERMKEWKVPGVGIAIVKDGQVILAQGYGLRDVKNSKPVTPHTLFAIGSCTKAMTAAALGILVDEGKLTWDTRVREHLPSFTLYDEYVSAHMTARDLVTHRSGLPRHDALWYNSSLARRELFDRLRHLPASRGFRAQYQYQNLMYLTAGILVEEISKGSWEQFIQRRFLEPLEMKASNFSVKASQQTADFALPYQEREEVVKEIPFRVIDSMGPAGSVNSSVTEMANWVLMQLDKGKFKEKQILSEASLRETHTPQVVIPGQLRFDEESYSSYAMGWVVNFYRGRLRLLHGGGIDGFTANVTFFPRDNFGMVILTNLGGTPLPGILASNIADRLLGMAEVEWSKRIKEERDKARAAAEKLRQQGDPNRKTGTQPSHPLADFAGKYEHAGYGELQVALEGDALKLSYNGMPRKLVHYHYDIFEAVGEDEQDRRKVTFLTSVKGDIDRLTLALEPAVDELTFARKPEAQALDAATLGKLAGEYLMEAVGQKVNIEMRGTALFLIVPGQPEYELVPRKGLEFTVKNLPPSFSAEFKVDGTGRATELIMTQPNGTFTLKRSP